MQKIAFIIFATIIIQSCTSSNSQAPSDEEVLKEKLSADLVQNPRSANNIDANELNLLGTFIFDDSVHNFGIIKEGEKVQYEFSYTNTGKKDIIISNAVGSCGCTVPEYNHKPISPNEKGSIKVTFNSQGKVGYNEKTVTLHTNGNPSEYILKIQAEVEK